MTSKKAGKVASLLTKKGLESCLCLQASVFNQAQQLEDYLASVSDDEKRNTQLWLLRRLAQTMQSVHKAGICFATLTSEDVRVDTSGTDPELLVSPPVSVCPEGEAVIVKKFTKKLGPRAIRYVAPELVSTAHKKAHFTADSDVWAFGVIAFVVAYGVQPAGSHTDDQVLTTLRDGDRGTISALFRAPSATESPLEPVIQACLSLDLSARVSIAELLPMLYPSAIGSGTDDAASPATAAGLRNSSASSGNSAPVPSSVTPLPPPTLLPPPPLSTSQSQLSQQSASSTPLPLSAVLPPPPAAVLASASSSCSPPHVLAASGAPLPGMAASLGDMLRGSGLTLQSEPLPAPEAASGTDAGSVSASPYGNIDAWGACAKPDYRPPPMDESLVHAGSQPSTFVVLNVYLPREDVGVRMAFPRYTSVADVCLLVTKRLRKTNLVPEDGLERLPRYRIFFPLAAQSSSASSATGVWAAPSASLANFRLQQQDVAEMWHFVHRPKLLRIHVPVLKAYISVKASEETTVFDCIMKVLNGVPGARTRFAQETTALQCWCDDDDAWNTLEEDAPILSFDASSKSLLRFVVKCDASASDEPCSASPPSLAADAASAASLTRSDGVDDVVVAADAGPTDEAATIVLKVVLTDSNTRSSKLLVLPVDAPVSLVIKRARQAFLLKSMEYGLYVPEPENDDDDAGSGPASPRHERVSGGGASDADTKSGPRHDVWLEESSSLSDYCLTNRQLVEFRVKYRTFDIDVEGVDYCLRLAPSVTVEQVEALLMYNHTGVLAATDARYALHLIRSSRAQQMDAKRTMWSYTALGRLAFKRELQLVVFMFVNAGVQHKMDVDFHDPITSIIDPFLAHFNVASVAREHITVKTPAGQVLNWDRSLAGQSVRYNSSILLKIDEAVYESMERAAQEAAAQDASDAAADVSIWEEPEGTEYEVRSATPSSTPGLPPDIECATLNKLVLRLTAPDFDDGPFCSAFLMTYRSFATQKELFRKLLQRFAVPDTMPADTRVAIQRKVTAVMQAWVDTQYHDFDHDFVQELVDFVDSLSEQGFEEAGAELRRSILKRTCSIKAQSMKPMGHFDEPPPEPKLPKKQKAITSLWDFDPEELARQMTLLDQAAFHQIQTSEMLNQAWAKPKYQHLAPNLLALISRFNQIGLWVINSIVEVPYLKDRAYRLTRVVDLASHLLKLRNFHALMAVIGGLNNAAILRLKHTAAYAKDTRKLSKAMATKAQLEKVMNPEGNYASYRNVIKSSDDPAVPLMAVFLSDLIIVDENVDNVGDLINFSKRRMIHGIISQVTALQQRCYNLREVPTIAKFFSWSGDEYDEKELYEVSLSVEPRGCDIKSLL